VRQRSGVRFWRSGVAAGVAKARTQSDASLPVRRSLQPGRRSPPARGYAQFFRFLGARQKRERRAQRSTPGEASCRRHKWGAGARKKQAVSAR
jgi:hypothetical protein